MDKKVPRHWLNSMNFDFALSSIIYMFIEVKKKTIQRLIFKLRFFVDLFF